MPFICTCLNYIGSLLPCFFPCELSYNFLLPYLNQCPAEVNANAAETLCTITRNASSTLAIKLSSPRFALGFHGFSFDMYLLNNCYIYTFSKHAVLLQKFWAMHWKIHNQSLALWTHFPCVFLCWTRKGLMYRLLFFIHSEVNTCMSHIFL